MIVQISAGAVGVAICGFFASRAAGGVIGEYSKRLWFGRIEPFLSRHLMQFTRRVRRHIAMRTRQQRAIAELEHKYAELALVVDRLAYERDVVRQENETLRNRLSSQRIA